MFLNYCLQFHHFEWARVFLDQLQELNLDQFLVALIFLHKEQDRAMKSFSSKKKFRKNKLVVKRSLKVESFYLFNVTKFYF